MNTRFADTNYRLSFDKAVVIFSDDMEGLPTINDIYEELDLYGPDNNIFYHPEYLKLEFIEENQDTLFNKWAELHNLDIID